MNFVQPTRNGKGCAYVLNVILAQDEEEVEREQQTFHCHVYVPRETHDSHDKRVELASTVASSIYPFYMHMCELGTISIGIVGASPFRSPR